MLEQHILVNIGLGQFYKMLVVRKENDLRSLGQLGQDLQSGNGPVVIKFNQDIVNDEWYGFVSFQIRLKAGQPYCQIELVSSAVTHTPDTDDLLAARPDAYKHCIAPFVELQTEPLK